jgi:hypothetical protein
MRRFPPPWTIEELEAGFKIVDANGRTLAYVYGLDNARNAAIASLGSSYLKRHTAAVEKDTDAMKDELHQTHV